MKLGNYECKTTFWMDFSIAELFGESAIRDTYRRAMKEWKTDIVYLTELVMVPNHKCWKFAESNRALCELYYHLWDSADSYCMNNLQGEEMRYYLEITD